MTGAAAASDAGVAMTGAAAASDDAGAAMNGAATDSAAGSGHDRHSRAKRSRRE